MIAPRYHAFLLRSAQGTISAKNKEFCDLDINIQILSNTPGLNRFILMMGAISERNKQKD